MIITCELPPAAIEDSLASMIRPAKKRRPRRWSSLYPGQVDRLNGPAPQICIRNKSHQIIGAMSEAAFGLQPIDFIDLSPTR